MGKHREKSAPWENKPVAFVTHGHTRCPRCKHHGKQHGRYDTRCYSTSGAIHYMRCIKCGLRFKALDMDLAPQIEEAERRELLRVLETDAEYARRVLDMREREHSNSTATLKQAQAAAQAAAEALTRAKEECGTPAT